MADQVSNETGDLPERCLAYLQAGPPDHMTDYVPESITEIIIAHGAQSIPLDAELQEIANIIMAESSSFDSNKDEVIQKYMQEGVDLVKEILDQHAD